MKARIPINKNTQNRIKTEVKREYERQGNEIAQRNIKNYVCSFK